MMPQDVWKNNNIQQMSSPAMQRDFYHDGRAPVRGQMMMPQNMMQMNQAPIFFQQYHEQPLHPNVMQSMRQMQTQEPPMMFYQNQNIPSIRNINPTIGFPNPQMNMQGETVVQAPLVVQKKVESHTAEMPISHEQAQVQKEYKDTTICISPMESKREHNLSEQNIEVKVDDVSVFSNYTEETIEQNPTMEPDVRLEEVMGFRARLKSLENQEVYGVRVNGKNYGYHFGFHDPNCEIPAYQKEKVQMNHVKIGKMNQQVIALHVWCDGKDGELIQAETIYVRLEKIDALILFSHQINSEVVDKENEAWHLQLMQDQKERTFKLHTLNETYLLEEIYCESNIYGQVCVDYKIVGMSADEFILDYKFEQKQSGEKAQIHKEKLKIYIPVEKIVSLETK